MPCLLRTLNCTNMAIHRAMANHLHGSQPQAFRVRVLHQPQVSRLLLSLLQGRAARTAAALACQSDPGRFRAAEGAVSGHAGAVQRVQVIVHEHATREAEMIGAPTCHSRRLDSQLWRGSWKSILGVGPNMAKVVCSAGCARLDLQY